MMSSEVLITYLAVLLGFVFIPGPAVLLTLARASAGGTRVGLATGAGIAVGDLAHTAMAAIGLSAIVFASATMFAVVKYLGAAYLIYLGVKALRSAGPGGPAVEPVRISPRAAFRQAVALEVLNPKSALFFLAFLPQFVAPEAGHVWAQLLILGGLFVAFGLLATVVTALAAGRIGAALRRRPRAQIRLNKLVGAVYCGLGLRLALQDR